MTSTIFGTSGFFKGAPQSVPVQTVSASSWEALETAVTEYLKKKPAGKVCFKLNAPGQALAFDLEIVRGTGNSVNYRDVTGRPPLHAGLLAVFERMGFTVNDLNSAERRQRAINSRNLF